MLFSQRLSNFKKLPAKQGASSYVVRCISPTYLSNVVRKARSNASDDDDFIVPSDSDDDNKSIKSSISRSSTSSRRSAATLSDASSDEERPVKATASKAKNTSAKNKSSGISKAVTDGASSANALFLTAAEKREQGKKNEKKGAEDPYSFLADVKDVCIELSWSRALNTPFRKKVVDLESLTTTREPSLSLREHGKNSHHLKSR